MTAIINFPSEIPVNSLLRKHGEFKADKLRMYNALYLGGEEVHNKQIMNKLLTMRQIEKTKEGAGQYERRKERAAYINRAGGMIDWFVASCFPNDPRIITEPYSEYFDSLNENADGLGTHFCTLSRNCLRESMIGRRAYWKVGFPKAGATVAASDMDGLSARLNIIPAMVIDDWEFDVDGRLDWARSHNIECVRNPAQPWDGTTKERHTWTYYTADRIAIYEADADYGQGFSNEKKAKLISVDTSYHDFEEPPVFDVRVGAGQWVMDRVFDVVKALFQREAGVTWALDMQAYAIPVITGQQEGVPSISGSELLALMLQQGASLTFAAPPATIFEPLFKDVERLSKDLYEVVQSMAINASTIPQAGRLSGTAVNKMKEPMITLLESFAYPIKESAQRTLEAIARYRGEQVKIKLTGFDEPADVDLDDVKELIMGKKDGTNKRKDDEADNREDGDETGSGNSKDKT